MHIPNTPIKKRGGFRKKLSKKSINTSKSISMIPFDFRRWIPNKILYNCLKKYNKEVN